MRDRRRYRWMARAYAGPVGTARGAGTFPGFSLIELLMVLVIVGITAALALPRARPAFDRSAVRSAARQLAATVTTARAIAIRQGRPVQLRASQNRIWITPTPPTGQQAAITLQSSLDSLYDVQLTQPVDSIVYDARGIATNLTQAHTFVLTRGAAQATVCVSRLGLVSSRCTL